jgi:hypothetical protein
LKPDGLYNKRKYSPFIHRDQKKINTSTNLKIPGLSFVHPFPEISILGFDFYSHNLNNHNLINNFNLWLLNFRKAVNKFNNMLPQLRMVINKFNNPLPQLQKAILNIFYWLPQTGKAYNKYFSYLTNQMTSKQNINP